MYNNNTNGFFENRGALQNAYINMSFRTLTLLTHLEEIIVGFLNMDILEVILEIVMLTRIICLPMIC